MLLQIWLCSFELGLGVYLTKKSIVLIGHDNSNGKATTMVTCLLR